MTEADPTRLPTVRDHLRDRPGRWVVICDDCGHQAEPDMAALLAAGYGDVPVIHLPLRCSACGSPRWSGILQGRQPGDPAPAV